MCNASGRCASTCALPISTSTTRPWAAASAMIRSVTFTIVVSSCSARGTASDVMNISGEATASVRASRSSSPGARSSCSATVAGASPARRATSSTNSLSITVHASAAATCRATAAPPDAYCRVIVMTGGAISGLQVLPQLADVEQRHAALGGHEDDQGAGALHVVQHFDPLLGERLGRQRLVQQPLLLVRQPGHLHPVPLGFNVLLLRDLVVDRLHDLSGRLQVAQEEGRDRGDAELTTPGARGGHQRGVHQSLHRVGDRKSVV